MTDFRSLHRPGAPFILCNVWDKGSARMLAGLGAQALATSSAAFGFTRGVGDMGAVSRDDSLAHAQEIVAATALPVQGDFENGFGDDPETCAETVRLAAEIGLAGICIEDTALPGTAAYDFDLAVERIAAAAAAARALPRDFVLFARADGCMNGTYDLAQAIRRIQAFDAAGADGLYVPLPPRISDIAAICAATSKPVNVLVAGPFATLSLAEYAAMGAARLSLGSALARVTHRVINDLSLSMLGDGDFNGLGRAMKGADVDALLLAGSAGAAQDQ